MTSYEEQVAQQISQYADVTNMHELPASFHFWSHNYIRPGLKDVFGVESVLDFYLEGFARASAGSGDVRRTILSLGCGDGWLEIEIAKRLAAAGDHDVQIVGADISPILVERFRAAVQAASLGGWVTPMLLDLNASSLRGPWTMVMANHALHHFVELERIFDYCRDTLSPGGLFVTNDMIGRNGHMRWPEAASILRALWPLLDVRQRYHLQLKRLDAVFTDHDCSTEGFEGIRAQDILPLLLERFHPENFLGAGGFVDILTDRGYGHGFDMENRRDADLVRFASELNEILLDADLVKPTIMFGYFSLDKRPERYFRQRSAARSVRREAPGWLAHHPGLDGIG